MAPVRFYRDTKRPVEPFAIAPWAEEKMPAGQLPCIAALRGDFFCMPFGGSEKPYRGRAHPFHGETANRAWSGARVVRDRDGVALSIRMKQRVQPGDVTKTVTLRNGHNAVYASHVIEGMSGPMTFAHHPTLQFPDRVDAGRLSFSPHIHAATYHSPVESPEVGTYSILKPGQVIDDLTRVSLIDGSTTDLTRYPQRRGYEDLAMVCADTSLPFAWSAVTLAREGYVYFNVKNPRVMASTMLWFTNGGRHYAPWNGRHVNVMGMEETTTFWGDGLAASVRANDFSRRGIKTVHRLSARKPYDVRCIMGVARIPRGFNRLREIRHARRANHAVLIGEHRKRVEIPLDLSFVVNYNL